MRRMDRYGHEDDNLSRIDKNQDLYQNISSNVVYANISDVMNANQYDISSTSRGEYKTREDYQKMREYNRVDDIPQSRKDLRDFNFLYHKKENRIYDINSVLEEARKNRQEKDLKEGKRKLQNTSYNIFAGINREELEKYREEKKKRLMTPEEEEIRELIDTIASKTLAGEIDKATSVDLLSDLMATSMLDKVDSSANITKDSIQEAVDNGKAEVVEIDENGNEIEVSDKDDKSKEEKKEETGEFYSKSMEMLDNDLDLSMEFRESSLPLPVKILIILVILAMIAAAAFFIYQRIR